MPRDYYPPKVSEAVRKIVREEIQIALQERAVPQPQGELPPVPGEKIKGKGGRKVSPGIRKKISIMLDEGILKAFEQERKRRRMNASELANILLWNALNKPKMSFEEEK